MSTESSRIDFTPYLQTATDNELLPKRNNLDWPYLMRLLLIAPTESGKTFTLADLLLELKGQYDPVLIIGETLGEGIYKLIEANFENVYFIGDVTPSVHAIEEQYLKPKKDKNGKEIKRKKNLPALIVLDDQNGEKKNMANNMKIFKYGRKLPAAMIYQCQKFMATDPFIREQCNLLMCKNIHSPRECENIAEHMGLDKKVFRAMMKEANTSGWLVTDFTRLSEATTDPSRAWYIFD